MRTSEPHTKALTAPQSVPVTAQPIAAGSRNVVTVSHPKARSTRRIPASLMRSGVHSFGSERSGSSSHPTCACHSPMATPFTPAARARCGECGSPYWSANA